MTLLLQGILLGWSVAWPPGPINVEILRHGIKKAYGKGVTIGLGACSGDFIWALLVASGESWLAKVVWFKIFLSVVSASLLAWLSFKYLRQAWRFAKNATLFLGVRVAPSNGKVVGASPSTPFGLLNNQKEISSSGRSVYLLGLGLALSSPWNISFWIAVIGQQAASHLSFFSALAMAGAVLFGALLWMGIFTLAIRLGARFFTHRWWLIGTELLTGLLMGFFFLRLLWRLTSTSPHSN